MGGLSNPTTAAPSVVYGSVANYNALPVVSECAGEAWLVLNSQGVWPTTLKRKGLWYSNGISWGRKGVVPRHDQLPDVVSGIDQHCTSEQIAALNAEDWRLLSPKWTTATRPASPGIDLVGYNMEEKRPELYVLADDVWYYLWQGIVGVAPPTSPAIFSDDFESGWFDVGGFSSLFLETCESGWFTDNLFSFLLLEDFENGGW